MADKRDKLENGSKGTIFSQVIKSRGWTKVDDELLKKIHSFVRHHPHVVQSPLANDMATVKDESGLPIKVPKLLLQIPIRVLHNDLLKNLPEARDSDGKALVSDTKLRQILPKELRLMSERYKIMCACLQCLKIQYLQNDYNQYKKLLLKSMENKRDLLCPGTRQWSQQNAKHVLYKNEIRIDPRPSDAVRRVQCQPIDNGDPDLKDLTHIDCAYGVCQLCPKFELPLTEQSLTETDLLISFHTYQQVTSCGIHLALSSGETECHACATRQIGEPIGRLTKKTQLVLMNVPFKTFFENYYLPSLMKYRMHIYCSFIIL